MVEAEVGLLLMAAGQGRRFKKLAPDTESKLLTRMSKHTDEHILSCSMRTAISVFGSQVHVVVRGDSKTLLDYAKTNSPSHTVLNSTSLGDSIVAGVQATAHWAGWLIMLADLPYIQPATLLRVANALQFHITARPIWQGAQGHPVGFRREAYKALSSLSGLDGASSVLKLFPPHLIDTEDDGVVWDIDEPTCIKKAFNHLKMRHCN